MLGHLGHLGCSGSPAVTLSFFKNKQTKKANVCTKILTYLTFRISFWTLLMVLAVDGRQSSQIS